MTNPFDDKAATWDEDETKTGRARRVADAVADVIDLRGDESVLEYGAGTGLLTQALGERVGDPTLADSSAGMRDVLRRKIDDGALPAAARVWDLDLAHDDVPADRFDLVTTLLVLHHIPQLTRVLEGFHELLEPGGHVAIADLDEEDGSFHDHFEGFAGHNGFNRESLGESLRAAGFVDVRFTDCGVLQKDDREFGIFLATARKPEGHGSR